MKKTIIATAAVISLPLLTALGCSSNDSGTSSSTAGSTSASQSATAGKPPALTTEAALELLEPQLEQMGPCVPTGVEGEYARCTVDISNPYSTAPGVTVLYDGLRDDSVGAVRAQTTFTYTDGRWQPGTVEMTYRCNRPDSDDQFLPRRCP